MSDKLSWHELMDRTSMISDIFDRFITEHIVAAADPEIHAAIEEISDKLGRLYQLVGTKALGDDDGQAG